MANTTRKTAYSYFRKPKGHKQALINNSRPKAVPADAWDDSPFSEGDKVFKIVMRMIGRFSEKDIIDRVARKTGANRSEVADCIFWARRRLDTKASIKAA